MSALQNVNIDVAGLGDNTIITGVAAAQIRIHRLVILNNVATAQTVLVKDGASTTLATIPLPSSIGGGPVLGDLPDRVPQWVLSSGNSFILNLAAATAVRGYASYSLG